MACHSQQEKIWDSTYFDISKKSFNLFLFYIVTRKTYTAAGCCTITTSAASNYLLPILLLECLFLHEKKNNNQGMDKEDWVWSASGWLDKNLV